MRPLFAAAVLAALAAPPSPALDAARLPAGIVGKTYTGGPILSEGGGACPRNYTTLRVVAGSLPPGLYLSSNGQFAGAPAEPGRFEFIIRAQNECGWSDQQMTIEVTAAPVLLLNPAVLEYRIAAGQTVDPVTLRLSSNVPGTPYEIDTAAAWLRARARQGRTPAAGSVFEADTVEVTLDTAGLPPGTHRGWVRAGAWRASEPAVVPVTVTVLTPALTAPPADAPRSSSHPQAAIPRISLAAPAAGYESGDSHAAPPAAQPRHSAGSGTATASAKTPPAPRRQLTDPARMSRSAQLRSRYLASQKQQAAASPTAPAAKPAEVAKADPHAKPSALGKPVEPAKPAADAHAKPAAPAPAPAAHGAKPPDAKPAAPAAAPPPTPPKQTAPGDSKQASGGHAPAKH